MKSQSTDTATLPWQDEAYLPWLRTETQKVNPPVLFYNIKYSAVHFCFVSAAFLTESSESKIASK